MGSKLGFILFATVVSLYTSAFGETSSISLGGCTTADCFNAQTDAEIKKQEKLSCIKKREELEAARAKASAACKAAKYEDANDCSDLEEACADGNSKEMDGDSLMKTMAGQAMSAFGASMPNITPDEFRKSCLGRKDFKDEKKDLKTDADKLDEKVSKLKDKITETQEKAEEEKRKTQEALQDLLKEGRKSEAELAKAERDASAESQKTMAQAKATLASLQADTIRAQGQLAKAIGERTKMMAQLSDALIQKNCMEALEKVQQGMKAFREGSANAVIKKNRTRAARTKLDFNACLDNAKTTREAGLKESNSNIDAMQADIDGKVQQMKDLNSGLSLATQHSAQEAAERQKMKMEATTEQTSRAGVLNSKYLTIQQATTQKITQYQQELTEANTKKNQISNELALLGKPPTTDKGSAEVASLMAEVKEKEVAVAKCDKGKPNESTPTPSSTPIIPKGKSGVTPPTPGKH